MQQLPFDIMPALSSDNRMNRPGQHEFTQEQNGGGIQPPNGIMTGKGYIHPNGILCIFKKIATKVDRSIEPIREAKMMKVFLVSFVLGCSCLLCSVNTYAENTGSVLKDSNEIADKLAQDGFMSNIEETITPEKRNDIVKLMNLLGTLKISEMFMNTVTDDYFNGLKKLRPDISAKVMDIIKEESKATVKDSIDTGGLISRLIVINNRYFTHAEIKSMLDFYESPIGKKIIRVMPVMTKESLIVGAEWQKSMASDLKERLIKRLQKDGIKF